MRILLTALVAAFAPAFASAQATRPAGARPDVSAAIANVRYELTFDSATAARRTVRVAMAFDVVSSQPVLLSIPVWTPGAYDVSNFARKVSGFGATLNGEPRRTDRLDPDTWRVRTEGAGAVRVTFDVLADTLDNAMAWSRPDFAMLNGTNVFPYPEGQSLIFPATVTVRTEAHWRVATGMHAAGLPRQYRESNYHDLVDMPFFIGRFDVDSMTIAGRTTRLASYPAGRFAGEPRERLWRDLAGIIPAESAVTGVMPWDDYTILTLFPDDFGGGSALEHQNSHVGIYTAELIGHPLLTNITAHEIFHAWNVKRLRPAEMVPYAYAAMQPTTLLWVSEGFTDYYADLASVRGGAIDSAAFLASTLGHINVVANTPPVSVEDASLAVWIHPQDGTDYIYYDKGSLIGLLLDIRIRAASDNRGSLDAVLRGLYEATALRGRGFTNDEFWAAVRRAAGGLSFDDFSRRFVDGAEPLPYDSVLPLAGLRLVEVHTRVPRMGVSTGTDSSGSRVASLVAGGAFEAAGVLPGDYLLSTGGIDQARDVSGAEFRRQFADREGEAYVIVVRRGAQTLSLTGRVRLGDQTETRLEYEPLAGPQAQRIRAGILRGVTDR